MNTETADISMESPETETEIINEAPKRLSKLMTEVKDKISDASIRLNEKGKTLCKVTDAYVHENPYKTLGIVAGLGLFLGLLLRRRA